MIKLFLALTGAATAAITASEYSFAEVDKCTAIIVGKSAGTEGPMTTHTADCSDCDFRIAKVNNNGPTDIHYIFLSSADYKR